MPNPPRRKCRKCGKHSARGRVLEVPHRITGHCDPRVGRTGDELPAGAFVCWLHFNAYGPCGLEPMTAKRPDAPTTGAQAPLF